MSKRIKSENLEEWVKYIQLDFMQMEEFIKRPLIFNKGRGVYLEDIHGRKFIDGIAGVLVTHLGYGNKTAIKAIKDAADGLLFWPKLKSTTPLAVRLAKRLAELLPGDLNVSFLASGGAEVTEAAMKLARQYHVQMGNSMRYKIIARHWSYHGATKGALSASGVNKGKFEPLAIGYIHVLPPYCYRCPFGQRREDCNLECVHAIDWEITMEGRDLISAVIVDPIMAACAGIVPRRDYYKVLREVCDKHGVLLIFDEVITGFGRLGEMFACDLYDVIPDMVCLGKGLGSGYVPISAMVARQEVMEVFKGSWGDNVAFMHGTTYGGHPICCAVALAVIQEIIDRDLLSNAKVTGEHMRKRLNELKEEHQIIGDVRGEGLLNFVEFVKDTETKELFKGEKLATPRVVDAAFKKGLLLRSSSHVLTVAPALIVTDSEIDEMMDLLDQAISETEKEVLPQSR